MHYFKLLFSNCFEAYWHKVGRRLKITSATKHKNTAKDIIIYTHRVYSLLLKLENNKV